MDINNEIHAIQRKSSAKKSKLNSSKKIPAKYIQRKKKGFCTLFESKHFSLLMQRLKRRKINR